MDLFVDEIDFRLQSRENYLKLLKSKKRHKKSNTDESNAGNEGEKSHDEKKQDSSQHDLDKSNTEEESDESLKKDLRKNETAKPFLNTLIDHCTELVRLSNEVSTLNYRNLLNNNPFPKKVDHISKLCKKTRENIESIVKKLAKDHVFDDNTNTLDVLFDQIEYGLKKHNRTKYSTDLTDDPEINRELDDTSCEMEENCVDKRQDHTGQGDDDDVSEILSRKNLRKTLNKLEKAILDTYSIEVDVSKYDLSPRPQDQWKDYYDNFSTRFYNPNRIEKFNKIEPQIVYDNDYKEVKFFEKGFVPKIYPKYELLQFLDRDNYLNSHLYSQELHSLNWSEDPQNNTHQGHNLLGGNAHNLLKISKNSSRAKNNTERAKLSFTLIDNVSDFDTMVEKVKKCPIVSIDVEHHDTHTYRGFICLIQLSTVNKNYIIDPFKMFDHMSNLNKITTDPKILKVMHGSSNDVTWLQRDSNIFIVNLFDTREAAKVLNLSEQSLSKLINKYFNIKLDKTHQLSDWSKRPLSVDMLNYACSDSYYLIPLYVRLKDEILTKPDGKVKILQVMNNSRNICLKQFVDKGPEIYLKFRSIAKRYNIDINRLDFITYNFFLNLVAFRNYLARKLDLSERTLIRDYKISTIVRSLRNVPYHQLVTCLSKNLNNVKYEIHNIIKIKNTIELIYNKLNKMELMLIKPKSLHFILNCIEDNKLSSLRNNQFDKMKHASCINNTIKVYNKFVAGGFFNNISPFQQNLKTIPLKKPINQLQTISTKSLTELDDKKNEDESDDIRVGSEKSDNVYKRSLIEESDMLNVWKRKKF